MQSQLQVGQSGVGIEPLTFQLEIEEPNPLAITISDYLICKNGLHRTLLCLCLLHASIPKSVSFVLVALHV